VPHKPVVYILEPLELHISESKIIACCLSYHISVLSMSPKLHLLCIMEY
jgi:hypothetical protein